MSEQFVPQVPPRSRNEMELLAINFIAQWAPLCLEIPGAFPVLRAFEELSDRHPELVSGVDQLQAGVEGVCWPDGRVF